MYDVVQVIPQQDFTVIVYFADGIIKKYDAAPLLDKGVFKQISDITVFIEKCTVLNNTLAWDLAGGFDPYNCLDIAPDTIYLESESIHDPLSETA